MNPLVYHIVSGQSFFTGIALIITAAVCSIVTSQELRRIPPVAAMVGLLAVTLSSTAVPIWIYAIAGAATLTWIASVFKPSWRRKAACAMCIGWLAAAAFEIPRLFIPTIREGNVGAITIIGDSVTAGIGADDKSQTWPNLFALQHHIVVQDISHMGETAASALERAKDHVIDSPIILLEIGGNDVLGSTSAADFENDLDQLIQHLQASDRQLIMFELPVPPFCHAYSYAQRDVAARHSVKLIPRRIFLSTLAAGGATLDSIHLSQSGHQQMADAVWSILEPAFSKQRNVGK